MPRPITINNCVTGHQVGTVYKFKRGSSWRGRSVYGTEMRCECGHEFQSNEGPPSATKKWQNEAYRRHVPELGPPTPEPESMWVEAVVRYRYQVDPGGVGYEEASTVEECMAVDAECAGGLPAGEWLWLAVGDRDAIIEFRRVDG